MDVKKISGKENSLKFLVKGTDTVFVNSIRRAAMNSVPTMAIDSIQIYENDSVMFDEMLGHRLGLLPIKTDLKAYKVGDRLKMVLEKEGPCTVYSRDIQSTEPTIEVIEKKVPLVKLAKDQKLKLELEAVVGTGKTHAKWQPAIVSCYEVPEFSLKVTDREQKKFLEQFPKEMFDIKADKAMLSDSLNASPDLVDLAVNALGEKTDKEGNSFILSVESFGQLEASEVLLEAANALSEKVKAFKEELKKI